MFPYTRARRINAPTVFNAQELVQFSGTIRYNCITRKHQLSDSAKYLADVATPYCLIDAGASLLDETDTVD